MDPKRVVDMLQIAVAILTGRYSSTASGAGSQSALS
jgi:hypothetical protein